MSRSLNRVTLIGNVGGDPEIRATDGGTKVAVFSLATSRTWRTKAGDQQEHTDWHRCTAWNSAAKSAGLADIVERFVHKGDKIYVDGRIKYRDYEDRSGTKRSVAEIHVTEILLLGPRRHAPDEVARDREA
jgi:single-strand DNA-binding protein